MHGIQKDEFRRAILRGFARNPIPSLIATKELILASGRARQVIEAHERESLAYKYLMGPPANEEAAAAFLEKRDPEFSKIAGS